MVAALRSFIREKHVVVRSRQLDHQSWGHALLFVKNLRRPPLHTRESFCYRESHVTSFTRLPMIMPTFKMV